MKNDLTCGVVRDLLPSYVEGLTAPETNEAVERHLSDCADCERLRAELEAGTSPARRRRSRKSIISKKSGAGGGGGS